MKQLILAIFALSAIGCATTQQHRWEWDVNTADKAKIDQANVDDGECKNFAYRSSVAGSKYTELDIHISCMQRKGYKLKKVMVGG